MRSSLLMLIACLTSPVVTFAQECPREEAMAAEVSAARLTDWEQIYGAFERFSQCDDGAIAEGFTDSVVRLLATHWETLHQISSFESKNPTFRTFVLRHINDTADTLELKQVTHLARTQCPEGHSLLCSDISQAAIGDTHAP